MMIASEGKIIIIPTIIILFIGITTSYLIDSLAWISYFNYTTFCFLLFSVYFFREPKRKVSGEANEMLSPADGKVIQIIDLEDPEIGQAKQISIFLSVFNVHSQFVPIDSKVIWSKYHAGKYLMAFNHKTSTQNERTSTLFEAKGYNRYKIKQIAGFIARRILNYMKTNQIVDKGHRLGFIRFGSRVEIVIPKNNFEILVKKGDKVRANLSSIGIFK